MIIGDPIVQKILERALRRRLTADEKAGLIPVNCRGHKIKIPQVSLTWLANKNSCK